MEFKVYGPFILPRTHTGLITTAADQKGRFWKEVEDLTHGLSKACGCFIFAISPSGGGARPWYVGMTRSKGFCGECFQPHKVNLYNSAIAEYERGNPLLYLIPKLTPSKKAFSKTSANGHADIKALENVLIGIAYAQNQDLLNVRGTKVLKNSVIPGVMNSPPGKPGEAALKLRSLLGL